MKKLLFALLVLFAIAACGNKQTADSAKETGETTEETITDTISKEIMEQKRRDKEEAKNKGLDSVEVTDQDIADKLNIKSSYSIKKTKELTRLYSKTEIGEIISKLAEIDILMKTTDQNPESLIEDFILTITK